VQTGKCLKESDPDTGHQKVITSMSKSADGSHFITGSHDKSAKVFWNPMFCTLFASALQRSMGLLGAFWCSIGMSKMWCAAYSWLDASVLMTVFNVLQCPHRICWCQCLQCDSLLCLFFGQISCSVACYYWEGLTKFVGDMWNSYGILELWLSWRHMSQSGQSMLQPFHLSLTMYGLKHSPSSRYLQCKYVVPSSKRLNEWIYCRVQWVCGFQFNCWYREFWGCCFGMDCRL
jgi:WD40 repeat protein